MTNPIHKGLYSESTARMLDEWDREMIKKQEEARAKKIEEQAKILHHQMDKFKTSVAVSKPWPGNWGN